MPQSKPISRADIRGFTLHLTRNVSLEVVFVRLTLSVVAISYYRDNVSGPSTYYLLDR